jgi:15-cis-phytoene synthase
MDLSEAYRRCEDVTRDRAKNFYYGIRLLPVPKRRALCAVYAFARGVDDVGDGSLATERKLAQLSRFRAQLAGLDQPGDDPVMAALADAVRRYPIPFDAFGDLVDGVEMDVAGTTYGTFEELVVYCRRVAGAVGRLCLGVFGSTEPARAVTLADDLGVALQLVNILRDVKEDLGLGRIYLPAEDLARFGCDPELVGTPDALAAVTAFEAARAREWYARGEQLVLLLDRRSAACVSAMAGIYGRILARIERDPAAVQARRIALPPWEKAWVAGRSLAWAGIPG